jgi:hypothetical protein
MNAATKQQILSFYAANKAAIDDFAAYMGIPPLWAVAVFQLESSLNPKAKNSIGAVGLNQMMPSTLADYNLTPTQYQNFSVAQQLGVMKKFFKPIAGKVKRAGDLYLYNLYPAAVIQNWPFNYPIGKNGELAKRYGVSLDKIYDQNAGLDFNKDGELTRQDVTDLFETRYDEVVSGNFFFPGPSNRLQNKLAGVADSVVSPYPGYLSGFKNKVA